MTDEEKDQEQEQKPESQPLREWEALIYAGPNVRTLGLVRNRIYEYSGGLWPYVLREASKAYPEVSRLIVPVSKYVETLRKIQRKGTPEHRAYELLEKTGK